MEKLFEEIKSSPKDEMNVSIFEPHQTILSNLKYEIIMSYKNKKMYVLEGEPHLNPIWTPFRECSSLSSSDSTYLSLSAVRKLMSLCLQHTRKPSLKRCHI